MNILDVDYFTYCFVFRATKNDLVANCLLLRFLVMSTKKSLLDERLAKYENELSLLRKTIVDHNVRIERLQEQNVAREQKLQELEKLVLKCNRPLDSDQIELERFGLEVTLDTNASYHTIRIYHNNLLYSGFSVDSDNALQYDESSCTIENSYTYLNVDGVEVRGLFTIPKPEDVSPRAFKLVYEKAKMIMEDVKSKLMNKKPTIL